ncbi:MAG: flagellar filament capping protein FliD, partial [Lachnospiraceae bacterium]|nr:flagellar filament capping protein FliD [Lachnospiraceae bacterium]
GATNGTHVVSVKQVASSAYMTGASFKSAGKSYTAYEDATGSTKFADMTDGLGNSLGLAGQSITISSGNGTVAPLTFELGGTGDNGVANLDELNKKLKETSGYEKLSASFVDGQIVFTNASATKDAGGNEIGEIYNIESSALGLTGEVGYKSDADAGLTNTLSGMSGMSYKRDFTSSDITNSTRLSDIGINVGTSFNIKGKEFVVDDKTTIEDLAKGLSKMGVNANFDAKQGRFYINAAGTGAENDFNLTSTDADALEILGLGTKATKVDAKDAIIEYNGVEYTNSENKFDINGLSITAKAVTTEAVNVDVTSDTESAYNTVKEFVKSYNALVDEMTTMYYEKDSGYDPLTEEERSKLSDTQIEQWEKKAKEGLMRRDSTIGDLLSNMRSILNQGVEVTQSDGSVKRMSLASLGIVTGDYTENGKLHILGDPDDAAYSSQENKLKKALSDDPDIVAKVLAGNTESEGVGTKLYSYMTKAMKRVEGSSSSLTFYNDVTMDEELKDYDDDIDKWQEKLQKLEDKYYDQFAAMEKAMAALQQQQSYIASLMGTA